MAECAYAAIYAMRDPKGKKVSDIFPQLFEDEDDDIGSPISEEDEEDLQALMDSMNHQSETQP